MDIWNENSVLNVALGPLYIHKEGVGTGGVGGTETGGKAYESEIYEGKQLRL